MKIKTLAVNVSPDDDSYNQFRKRRVMIVGEHENEVECYDVDGSRENSLKPDDRFPQLSHESMYYEETEVVTDAIRKYNPHIIITGQSKVSETVIIGLRSLKYLAIRFSKFYPGGRGYGFKTTRREGIIRSPIYSLSAGEAGYHLDAPKCPESILEFLQDVNIIDAVAMRNQGALERAVEEFNSGKKQPILKTSFFANLWK